MAPLLALAIGTDIFFLYRERQSVREEAMGRAHSLMSAIDAAVAGSEAELQTLAASPTLARGDLRAFHDESRRFLTSHPQLSNIGLSSTEGEPLTNAVLPFGVRPQVYADLPMLYQAVKQRMTTYGNVAPGPAIGTSAVRIRIPVIVGDAVRYVISAPHRLDWFEGILRAQGLPQDWVIALVDHERHFIARVPRAPADAETSPSLGKGLDKSTTGWLRGRTLEGRDTYMAYVTSNRTGWALSVAIPAQGVDGPLWRAISLLLAVSACAVVIAVLLAARMRRAIEDAMSR